MNNLFLILLCLASLFCGCSDSDTTSTQPQEANDHVWKEQTDAIEKAKSVEGMLLDSAEQQSRQIQEQTE